MLAAAVICRLSDTMPSLFVVVVALVDLVVQIIFDCLGFECYVVIGGCRRINFLCCVFCTFR